MRQFSIISPENSDSNFQCRSYERFHYGPNMDDRFHMHAFSEIFFITEGSGFFVLKDNKVPIHRGMIVINNSNVQHMLSSSSVDDLEYAVLGIDNLSFFSNSFSNSEHTFFLDFSAKYSTVFKFIAEIEWEWIVRPPLWQCALQTQFNSYILYILRNSDLMAFPVQNSNRPNPLANVHLYLTANYSEDITLDKLADMFCINKYYLAHTFKEIYGSSIIHTLNQIRCETARNLLQNSDYSISDISANVGYNSCSYFSKIYRKFFGETPLQTRNAFFAEQKKP